MIRALLLLLLLALPGAGAGPGRSEAGNASIRNWRPRDYAGQSQNWAVVQDQRGLIYVANGEGVLEFDGDRWRLIATPNRTVVRSLAMDATGRIYVGAVGEVGYLAPDRDGRMAYVSLNHRIDAAHATFGDVWKIHPTARGVFFFSSDFIFLLGPDTFRSWQVETPLHLAFGIGERFLVQQLGVGLLEADGDQLRPLPGGAAFAQDKIYFILPWDGTPDGRLLIGTRARGLFLYDHGALTPFPTEADRFLQANLLYQGVQLRDGTLALGTLQGGVALVARDGRLQAILDKPGGLLSSTIYALFPDRQAGLWMGLGTGIARVQWPASFSQFDASTGLEGTVLTVHRHGGDLIAGTSQGVYLLEPRGPDRLPHFRAVTGIKAQTWRLISAGDAVLAGNYQGVYRISQGKGELLQPVGNNVLTLGFAPDDPGRVYVGQQNGLASLRLSGGRWLDEGLFPAIRESVNSLEDAGNGRLWLGTTAFGPMRVAFPRGRDGNPVVERFGTAHGLPAKKQVMVARVGGQVVFTTSTGVFVFDEINRRFLPDPRFATLFQDGPRRVVVLKEDAAGRVWIQTLDEARHAYDLAVGTPRSAAFDWQRAPFLRFNNLELNAIYPEPDGVVWFGGAEGLFRYDPAVPADMVMPYAAHVRQVNTAGERLLFGGGGAPAAARVLKAGENVLRFEFSATSFDTDWANRYSIRLEGRDGDWSPWSITPFKEYSYLPEGHYVFRVRARNVYGTVSQEGRFAFVIPPPWHRSWWARLLFLGLAGAGLAAVQRATTRLLRRRNLTLQRRIQEATRELVERERLLAAQAGDLEHANTQLLAMNEQKNQFIGIVAHDLRNPLNGILLASELLQEAGPTPEGRRAARMIQSECREMDDLIARFLDIAAIEAGTIRAEPVPCDLAALAAQVMERHAVMAEQKAIAVHLEVAEGTGLALADPSFAKEILDNLLSNAMKFSPRGAAVALALAGRGDRILLSVRDQGPGLTEEDLAKLFSRFARLSAMPTAGERSLGLGLSIVKHMVDAMNGRIWVETAPGAGAAFHVELPAYRPEPAL